MFDRITDAHIKDLGTHGRYIVAALSRPGPARVDAAELTDDNAELIDTYLAEAGKKEGVRNSVAGTVSLMRNLDGPAILRMYSERQNVEAMNKTIKHPLRLRPCYHRAERRIRAHVMLTILAANCTLYLERETGLSIEKLRALTENVRAHEVEQGSKRYWQRGEVNPAYEQALEALGIKVSPLVWGDAWIERPEAQEAQAAGLMSESVALNCRRTVQGR